MARRLYWLLYSLAALCAGCAGVHRAADQIGEKSTAAAGGVGLGFLAWLVHPVGWIGAALAAAGGAVGSLLFGSSGPVTIHEAPTSPWTVVAVLVFAVLLARSWGHWLPPLLQVLKNTARATPRALLGGRPKPESKPNRFVRRSD